MNTISGKFVFGMVVFLACSATACVYVPTNSTPALDPAPVIDKGPNQARASGDAENEEPANEPESGKPTVAPSPKATEPTTAPDAKKTETATPSPAKKDPTTKPKDDDLHRNHLAKGNQDKVNKAIKRGMAFLKKEQQDTGSWIAGECELGYAALPALTLLECGVPATDAGIQKAAGHVRKHAPKHKDFAQTYELSLSVLFLDKLGDQQDHELIRYLAMRLIAGQRSDGGWLYDCPLLKRQEAHELFVFLHKTRPVPFILTEKGNFELLKFISKEPTKKKPGTAPKDKGEKPLIPAKRNEPGDKEAANLTLPFPVVSQDAGRAAKNAKPLEPVKPGTDSQLSRPAEPIFRPFNTKLLSESLQDLAVVTLTPTAKLLGRTKPLPQTGISDNSNTQFAIMALWVARKYNVPVEKTMALVDQRFLSTQQPDGGWHYNEGHPVSPGMTCAGLVGLAAGHGAHKESLGVAWKLTGGKALTGDPAIQKGLAALSTHIGEAPKDWKENVQQSNLYLLWSIERVAMLYNLKSIGGKDWYSWAAHQLVVNQREDGNWEHGQYHGTTPVLDTSFALLILKRANFVPDLTESLRLYIPIASPKARPAPGPRP